jgi:hypothetical protein
MNCTTCKDGFYSLVDKASQCYTSDTVIAKYVYTTNKFDKCYTTCEFCSEVGDSDLGRCTSCITDYYKADSNCHLKTDQVDHFYFNNAAIEFQDCQSSCLRCENAIDCTVCNTGYYPLEDNGSKCYKSDTNVPGYNFNAQTNKFEKQCPVSCSTCNGQLCIICASTYFPLDDKTSECHLKTETINGYYFSTNTFKKCLSQCNTI